MPRSQETHKKLFRFSPERGIPLLLALLAALGAACDKEKLAAPPPGPLSPAYILQEGLDNNAYLFGWAEFPEPLPESMQQGDEIAVRGYIPERPFQRRFEQQISAGDGDLLYHWDIGLLHGPKLSRRIGLESGESWTSVLSGWGDLALHRQLASADANPVVLDPLSPGGFALMGWRWQEAGRPETLDLTILWIPDLTAPVEVVSGRLFHDGDDLETNIPAHIFHLELLDQRFDFHLFVEHFPAPINTWWEQRHYGLRFWADDPPDNLESFAYDPRFPTPNGYAVRDTLLQSDGLVLAVDQYRPAVGGEHPAILLVADAGPRDRDGGALFGHLAHELAMRGWIVYRYDKPGTGTSGGDLQELDLATRRNAMAAVWQLMRQDFQADLSRTLLLGHGEGAALALEKAALDETVAGVAALAPPYYDPASLPAIPEVGGSAAEYVDLLDLQCFADKYRDLEDFSSADYLPLVTCPVALYLGGEDPYVSEGELLDNLDGLPLVGNRAARLLDPREDPQRIDVIAFPGLGHEFNFWLAVPPHGFAADPPDATVVDRLTAWLIIYFP